MPYSHTSPVGGNENLLGPSLAEYCSASAFVTFATILNSLIRSNNNISGICERIKSVEPGDIYDFVVIGGGAGGSVVASRLSENPDWKVLLLENGMDEPAYAEVPMLFLDLLGTVVDWNYTTSNESYGCLSTNGSCSITAGKMLGGSTAHNGMIYLRGNPSDFDKWAALGNEGWSFADVLPFFKKGEDNGEIDRVGTKYHSTGGLLSVERLPYLPPFGLSILNATIQAGFSISEDLNGYDISGFSLVQTTGKNGVRRSTAAAYLRPVRNRANLEISLNSTATKVIVENGAAIGVQYYKNGQFKTIRVRKEVIVSAGTIESPKLLLLSGIGPKKHLESVGVKVVHHLSGVGKNFHDQSTFKIPFTINEPDTYDYNWVDAAEYLAYQTGPLSGSGVYTVVGKVATNLTTPDSPDIEIAFTSYAGTCAPGDVGALRSSGRKTVQLGITNIQPKSRGRVSLASNNPLAYPVIWGNYLGDYTDVDRHIQGIELALLLTDTEAMRAHNLTMTVTTIEACSDHTYGSREYWTCALRQDATSDSHYVGTCKMGNSSDPMAVVDPRLRVRGIKGLRVADASIMPQVTSSNTAAPTMMIGERAAAFIKEDWAHAARGKLETWRKLFSPCQHCERTRFLAFPSISNRFASI